MTMMIEMMMIDYYDHDDDDDDDHDDNNHKNNHHQHNKLTWECAYCTFVNIENELIDKNIMKVRCKMCM